MAVRIDGQVIDMEPAVRHFEHYDHNMRAALMASHRQGHRARHRIGEAFWTHPLLPGVCFPTRIAALRAALATLAVAAPADDLP